MMPRLPDEAKPKCPGNSGDGDSDKESVLKIKKELTNPTCSIPNNSTRETNKKDYSFLDSITNSKKLQRVGSTRKRARSKQIKGPRICGNGKPMPSIAELNKMYEDSDDDENPEAAPTPLSPNSIKMIGSRFLDKLSNISDPDEFINLLPPQPIVKQKKPKKGDTPYIVGCVDRPQHIKPSKTKFGVGDKYGIYLNADPDQHQNCEKRTIKRLRKSKIEAMLSNSIFNSRCNDIVFKLNEENHECDVNSDINQSDNYNGYKSDLNGDLSPFKFGAHSTSDNNQTLLKKIDSIYSRSGSIDSIRDNISLKPKENNEFSDTSSTNSEETVANYDYHSELRELLSPESSFDASNEEFTLKQDEHDESSVGSADSNNTIIYDYYNKPESNGKSFELLWSKPHTFSSDIPYETVVIDDEPIVESSLSEHEKDELHVNKAGDNNFK